MRVLPIVERELRVSSRKPRTYWTRFIAGLTAIVLIAWMILTFGSATGDPQSSGKVIFTSLATIGFFFAVLAGTHTTADCISSEKRDGTLGLLFLTDLKGYDIVFGKLAATSLNALYSLLAIVPVMALPLLMGSVSLAEFGKVTLVLLITLFFSLSAGICGSSILKKEGNTVGFCVLVIVMFVVGAPAAGGLWEEFVGRSDGSPPVGFFLPSPGYTFLIAITPSMPRSFQHYWLSLATIHAISWLFLLVALFATPRSWQDKALDVAPKGLRERWRDVNYGKPETRRRWREQLLAINPVLWLSARNLLQFSGIWVGLGALVLIWLILYAKWKGDWLEMPGAMATAYLLHIFLKLRLIPVACKRFAEDRRAGALELLLSTPTTVKEILRGQLLAIRKQFAAPIILVLVLDTLLLLAALGRTQNEQGESIAMFVAGMVFLVADAVALSWVGMWQGLAAKNFTKACSNAATQILFLPWAIFLGIMFTLMALDIGRSKLGDLGFGAGFTLCFLVMLVVDVVFAGRARLLLLTQFRTEALRRYEPQRRWWSFLGEAR